MPRISKGDKGRIAINIRGWNSELEKCEQTRDELKKKKPSDTTGEITVQIRRVTNRISELRKNIEYYSFIFNML